MKRLGGALAAIGAVAAGALAWGALVERNRFTVREEFLPVLDPGADPIRVLHLSDLHLAPWQRTKREWVAALADLEPHLIVSTGDALGHADGIEALGSALAPFRGVPGAFVHGSNDYFGPVAKNPFGYFRVRNDGNDRAERLDTDALESLYASLGWENLNNRVASMDIRGSRLELLGVNDAHRNWDRLDELPGLLDELREDSTSSRGHADAEPVTIGLTHAPYQRVLNSFVNHGADVIFAGHTHGGQVRVPMVGALVANCDIPLDQAQGLSLWRHGNGAAFLEVSAGLGTSIFAPVRFGCPPEAVLVTLTADDFDYS